LAQEGQLRHLAHVADAFHSEAVVRRSRSQAPAAFGRQGGTLRTLSRGTKDVRRWPVYGYCAGWSGTSPITRSPPIFLPLLMWKEGPQVSRSAAPRQPLDRRLPFTSDDFQILVRERPNIPIYPAGRLDFYVVDKPAAARSPFPTRKTVVCFECSDPNPNFLPLLAPGPAAVSSNRPAHLSVISSTLKFADPDGADRKGQMRPCVKSWRACTTNATTCTKVRQSRAANAAAVESTRRDTESSRKLFVRKPYFHRIRSRGVQLPYIDVVQMTSSAVG